MKMEIQYYDKHIETMPREEMRKLQSQRLVDTVRRVYENVPLYRKRMEENNVEPADIKSIDDLNKLPFTYKTDLRDTFPYGMFAVPMHDVTRIHASSGTTGKQTVVGYTNHDLDIWAECVARCIVGAGGSRDDIVHVSYGYGLFTGGLGLNNGAEKLGASIIPVSTGNTSRQIQIMQDFGSTILCCTPSYALYIAETIRDQKIPMDTIKLRLGIFGAEPWTVEMRKEIERLLHIQAHDIYGLSEVCGPGVACDCMYLNGLHVHEDHFIPEVIDPDTGAALPDGQVGELVFSCVTKQALPLLRYRTKDLVSITHEKCECGRTLVRMNKPTGRTDDMLIIRGVNVFPSQVEDVLLRFSHVSPHYLIIVDRVNNLDTCEVQVEMSPELFSDSVKDIEAIEKKIRASIESTLGIAVKVTLVEPKSINRSEGKSKRVLDKRKI